MIFGVCGLEQEVCHALQVVDDQQAPDAVEQALRLARVLQQRGKPEAALNVLNERVLPRTPNDPNLLHFKGRCLEAAGNIPAVSRGFELGTVVAQHTAPEETAPNQPLLLQDLLVLCLWYLVVLFCPAPCTCTMRWGWGEAWSGLL